MDAESAPAPSAPVLSATGDPYIVELARVLASEAATRRPHIVGLSGSVAAGKSTIAHALAALLDEHGRVTAIIGTDCFLHPNAVLSDRGLLMRKGFPESYDVEAILSAIDSLRTRGSVAVPVYSHATYDIVPGATTPVEDADVVIIEGVNALQSPLYERLDTAIYVDADEDAVVGWFVTRFLEMCADAIGDPGSFYAMFSAMSDDARRDLAVSTWQAINGVNLRDHILPTRERAHTVIEKTADHGVAAVRRGRLTPPTARP